MPCRCRPFCEPFILQPFLSSTLQTVFFTAVFLSSDDETDIWRAPSYYTRFPERTTGGRHERTNTRARALRMTTTHVWRVMMCIFGKFCTPGPKKKPYLIYYTAFLYCIPVCCIHCLLTIKCLTVPLKIIIHTLLVASLCYLGLWRSD